MAKLILLVLFIGFMGGIFFEVKYQWGFKTYEYIKYVIRKKTL